MYTRLFSPHCSTTVNLDGDYYIDAVTHIAGDALVLLLSYIVDKSVFGPIVNRVARMKTRVIVTVVSSEESVTSI